MNNILAVALLGFKEGVRHRVLYGIFISGLLITSFAVLVSGFFLRDVAKVILDFCMATVTLGGLTIPFFLAINLLSRDIERRTIFTILSRPVSRGQYVAGKFFGLLLLTGFIMFFLSSLVWVSVQFGCFLFGARFFVHVSWLSIAVALFLSWLSVLILNALVVFWSTVTTSSFLATLLTVFSYIIGHAVDDVVRFIQVKFYTNEISQSVKATVALAKYLFPNLAAFDVKSAAAHGMFIPWYDVATLFAYAVSYIVVVLFLSTIIFNKRDLV